MNLSNSLNEQVKYFYIDIFVLFLLSLLYLSTIILLAVKFSSFGSIYIDLFYNIMICSIAFSSIYVLQFYVLQRTGRNENVFLNNNLQFAHASSIILSICTYLLIIAINVDAIKTSAKIFSTTMINNYFPLPISNHFQLIITCLMLLYLPMIIIIGIGLGKAIIAIQKFIDSI
ncbi:MAG: hypothetical protein E6Q32_04425 [Neisseriales bacterium]|nr:MAG: hypothetical protein E6Q32_04425 [Neisseriales bacterium]